MDDALWVNSNGMVVCLKHGGNYLQSAVESEPTWEGHVTPLDVWMKVDSAGSILDASCEVCSSRPLTVTTTSTQPTADSMNRLSSVLEMKQFGLTYQGDAPWWILGPTMKAIADDAFGEWIVEVQFFTSDDEDDFTDLTCTIVSVDGDHSVTLQPCDNSADPVGDTVEVALTRVIHITVL